MNEQLDTVIIGGGHAGLTMSYSLSQLGLETQSSNGMAAEGLTLLGHLQAVVRNTFIIAPDLQESLAKGDLWFTDYKKSVDDYVAKTGMDVPEEGEQVDTVAEPKEVSSPILELDLKTAGIKSIVWATGFRNDFGWVRLPIFNDTGEPVHRRGVTGLPGIYFLGLRWLYTCKSYFLVMAGPAKDAAYLAEHIKNRAEQNCA